MDQSQNLGNQGIYALSMLGNECLRISRKELRNFDGLRSIKEISINEAKQLGERSSKIMFALDMYTNDKATAEGKAKIVENMERDYARLVSYVRKFYRSCFEPRMVLLMCEAKMISVGIIPAKIKQTEIDDEDSED